MVVQNIRHAIQVDHQLSSPIGLWPQESPPGMSAGSLSMRDMALQTSRYYTTVDGAAALSATKELGLLYYQSETAARKLSIRYPQSIRTKSAQSTAPAYMALKHPHSVQFRWDAMWREQGKTAFIALVRKQGQPLGDSDESCDSTSTPG